MTKWWQNWQNNHYHSNSNDNKNGIVTKTIFFPHELSSSPIFSYSNILFSMANTSYLLWLLYSIFCGSHIPFSVTVTSHFLWLSFAFRLGGICHPHRPFSITSSSVFFVPGQSPPFWRAQDDPPTFRHDFQSDEMRIQEVTTKASSQ